MRTLVLPEYLVHAFGEIGTIEVKGAEHNQRIVQYWADAKTTFKVVDDEVAWCAAFVGAMLFRGGIEGTRKADAKSYADWGDEWTGLGLGAIVVLHRKPPAPSWQGHLGACVGLTPTHVHVLGGNQSDRVSIAAFPRARVMTMRRPKGVVLPASGLLLPVSAVEPDVA